MRLVGDDGITLDAELTVEPKTTGEFDIVLDSAGGTAGSQGSRNREYPLALETLLRRLARADARLLDVVVDSRRTRSLLPDDRRVHPAPWTYPLQLNTVVDFLQLRKAITRSQGNIASMAKAGGGNERKRIRLTFAAPNRLDLSAVETLLQLVGRSPLQTEETSPELADAQVAADVSAGKARRGQGFRQNVEAKVAIEKHAVATAAAFLIGRGFTVEDVGATQPFDLDARKGEEHLHVEVKGTTSGGSSVILTRGEVTLHKTVYPNNALVIVHSIKLTASADEPVAAGGVIVWRSPWLVDDDALKPISFEYTTGL
jgi:hypothetical protein